MTNSAGETATVIPTLSEPARFSVSKGPFCHGARAEALLLRVRRTVSHEGLGKSLPLYIL